MRICRIPLLVSQVFGRVPSGCTRDLVFEAFERVWQFVPDSTPRLIICLKYLDHDFFTDSDI